MRKRLTITLDAAVHDGLYRRVGKRRISQFIDELVRPPVLDTTLDAGYRAMAADRERAAEAQDWCAAATFAATARGQDLVRCRDADALVDRLGLSVPTPSDTKRCEQQ